MIEEFCKYLFGEDIWGWGVALIVAWTILIPVIGIPLLAELPALCKRLKTLEEKIE